MAARIPRVPAAHALALLPAALAALLVWRHAPGTWFTADDLVSLARAAGLEPTPPGFRPLSAVLAWRAEFAAFGRAAAGYHLVGGLLHLLNAAGVYALAMRLGNRRSTAAAAALLFAASGIAFTPLHAASGIGDLLALGLLLSATWIHLGARRRAGARGTWFAAALAFAAMLAKESALAWPLLIAAIELGGLPPWPVRRDGRAAARGAAALPALAAGMAGACWIAAAHGLQPSGAYLISFAPGPLAANLATYLAWLVRIGAPLRDAVALPDPGALPLGILTAAAIAVLVRAVRSQPHAASVKVGVAWLVAFLLPALPLVHHTYLYYLYLPWAGGSLALAAAGAWLLEALPVPAARLAGAALLVAFTGAEARAVTLRERATIAAVPADRTLREAALLRHAIEGLRAARLPAGTRVGFVNPVPGRPVALGAAARPDAAVDTARYYPLERLMRDGRALRLFLPQLRYAGFADTIPEGWEDVECFLFEQRGYLRAWGRGAAARARQTEWIAEANATHSHAAGR